MVHQIHGDSNVGKPSLYESGDQRNLPRDQRAHAEEVSKGLDVNGTCSWTRWTLWPDRGHGQGLNIWQAETRKWATRV